MSAISLWNYLLCRIRLSPKTAEAFREGFTPTSGSHLLPQDRLLVQAPLKPAPRDQSTLPVHNLRSFFSPWQLHLDCVFPAQRTWRGPAVTTRKVRLASLSLLPPGQIHLSSCKMRACLLPYQS